jgi:hypothetical protein
VQKQCFGSSYLEVVSGRMFLVSVFVKAVVFSLAEIVALLYDSVRHVITRFEVL